MRAQAVHIPLNVATEDFFKAIGCMILSGPLLTGYTQTMNDWYDRDIDAINEPYRPIPSGKIKPNEVRPSRKPVEKTPPSERAARSRSLARARARAPSLIGKTRALSAPQVIVQIWALLLGGLGLSLSLDNWAGHKFPAVFAVAVFGSFISYIYSAPPLKLKAEGWLGTYALGSSYIALPWWCGHAMFNAGSISAPEVVLTILYSIAGLGIAIVNDFKSIEGDRALGMNSLPVAFGIDTAKWICVASIDVTQLGVAAYLWAIGETWYAAVLAGLVLPQMFSQISFLQDPVNNDVKYQAAAQPFLVFGILTTALAVGHHTF